MNLSPSPQWTPKRVSTNGKEDPQQSVKTEMNPMNDACSPSSLQQAHRCAHLRYSLSSPSRKHNPCVTRCQEDP
ncbi:hypothetical protein JZ751_002160 [Albula glossodonta]|uniref:Uncharacterized protein n=1 Tax=Albula glossodonta TaxID=121402 RepID=A0A8T2P7A2_9TELE|nr:hypothetical protein JZ751_002160 [Albula glossodonta]